VVDPALDQVQRHVDRRHEEDQEDRDLHRRPGLQRLEAQRHAGAPQGGGQVDQERERQQPDELRGIAVDLHAREQRGHGDHGAGEQEARDGGQRVARDDPLAPRGAEQQAPAEARLEVGRGREAGEDPAEGGRLQEDEDELEGRVARREVEARHVGDVREAAREGDEEEQREDDGRHQQRRVLERVDEVAPQHGSGDGQEIAGHVRAILVASAREAAQNESPRTPTPTASPRQSAVPSHPVMTSERSPSMR